MRVVQSPNSSVARVGPSCARPPIIAGPACPDWTRRIQACGGVRLLNIAGMVRVYWLPSWWQDSQLSVLMRWIHCAWLLMLGEMPVSAGAANSASRARQQGVPIIGRVVVRRGIYPGQMVADSSLAWIGFHLGESRSP